MKLVRAGAPQSLLWEDPRTIDLDDLPYDSPLEQAVAEAEAEHRRRQARRSWPLGWVSDLWSGLERLRRERLAHAPPLGRADR